MSKGTGIYRKMMNYVKGQKSIGKGGVMRDELARFILPDVARMDHEDIARIVANQLSAVVLNANNARATIWGKGKYVFVDDLEDPDVWERIIENADGDVYKAEKIKEALVARRENVPGQMFFVDDPGFHETPTDEELEEIVDQIIAGIA